MTKHTQNHGAQLIKIHSEITIKGQFTETYCHTDSAESSCKLISSVYHLPECHSKQAFFKDKRKLKLKLGCDYMLLS